MKSTHPLIHPRVLAFGNIWHFPVYMAYCSLL